MGKEALYIPEEDLHHVIDVIRAGLKVESGVPKNVSEMLLEWCKEEAEYLHDSFYEEFWPKPVSTK